MNDDVSLLAVDVGNTNTVLGLFQGEELLRHWRLTSRRESTSDEIAISVEALLASGPLHRKPEHVIVANVVPPLRFPLRQALRQVLGREPVFVEPGVKTGMPILYDVPQEVGADRIVNAVAAYERLGGPCVVVDFGTATTFDVVTEKGEYAGGVIVPGISISAEALFEKAARLWRVEIRRPEKVVGKTTTASIQSGLYFGYLSLVDGMIQRIAQEIGRKPRVIATGGLAELFGGGSEAIELVDPLLTLTGLRLIHERNRGG
ncbi:MAG: type III pantothenate kinase [Thermoanaerobaculia bacterium]|nr:type III pantothenate kinase [Thermoanaerobaculia bacterium]